MDVGGAPEGVDEIAIRKRKHSVDDTSEPGPRSQDEHTAQVNTPPSILRPDDSGIISKKARLDRTASPPDIPEPDPVASISQNGHLPGLPAEILQHIFSYVDPISLGQLICVNHVFNVLLNPARELPQASPDVRHVRLREQNELWASSRRAFLSGFPRPMDSMTELAMWRLIRGHSCQFCGKQAKPKVPTLANSPWNAGPGPEGVRTVWPFRVRACGKCLESRSVKDTEILLSDSSALRPGLPFAIFTPSFNYVSSVTLRQSQPPPRLQLTKYYFRPQVEELNRKSAEVRGYGGAAAEEWYKGLEATGQLHQDDSARFEQWELGNSPQGQTTPTSSVRPTASPSPALSAPPSSLTGPHFMPMKSQSSTGPYSTLASPQHFGNSFGSAFTPNASYPMPRQQVELAPGQQRPLEAHPIPGSYGNQPSGMHPGPFQRHPHPRPEKNFRDIVQMKDDRRTEIERRCQQLEPPLQPSTLMFMEAFHAALQITMPLNDNAWELLKSRILAQRSDAERREMEQMAAVRTSQMEADERHRYEEQRRQAQENVNRTWSDVQQSAKEKIRQYADEFINVEWSGGRSVTKATSSKFAADVLQHVRQRFYEVVSQEDTILASQGVIIPQDSTIHNARRLKLEDMKWIFDEAIRPHTDPFGREIFLCSACDSHHKHFSLDAVIQHYAAKHTNSLSHGNTVVYWKADWPTEPPFHPSPDRAWGESNVVTSAMYTSRPPLNWMPATTTGQPNGIYHIQSDELVNQARQIWDATESILELPGCVRLYVIIHQVALRFSRKFTNQPTLSMFMDCVNNKEQLQPLKSLHQLTCKACRALRHGSSHSTPKHSEVEHGLQGLLQHFQNVHIEYDANNPQSSLTRPLPISSPILPRMDWKVDMVELPHESIIRNLIHSRGMDQLKLELIAAVFPGCFPEPLPQIVPMLLPVKNGATPTAGISLYNPRSPLQRHSEQAGNQSGSAMPPNNEYDPHRAQATMIHGGYHSAPQRTQWSPMDYQPQPEIVYIDRGASSHDIYGYGPDRGPYERLYRGPSYVVSQPVDMSYEPYLGGRRVLEYIPHGTRHHEVPHRDLVEDETMRNAPRRALQLPIEPTGESQSSLSIEAKPANVNEEYVSNAAENFLNNFDNIASDAFGGESTRSDLAPGHSTSISEAQSRRGDQDGTPVATQARLWQNGLGSAGRGSASSRHTPLAPVPGRRLLSPVPHLDGHATPLADDMAIDDDTFVRSHPRDPSIDDVGPSDRLFEPDTRRRRLVVEYDRNGLPLNVGDERVYERDHYQDYARRESRPVYNRLPPSPEFYRRRLDDPPVRYVEVLPSGERRIIEERPRYPESRYQPFDYVRVQRRDDRGASVGYQVEQRMVDDQPRELFETRGGYGSDDRREQYDAYHGARQ